MFDTLWKKYKSITPVAEQIQNQFKALGEDVVNDHIAIRTFNHSDLNIDKVAKPFIEYGYVCVKEYDFPEKKLKAKHYHHKTDDDMPKVFISQIDQNLFSKEIQDLINHEVFENLNITSELIFSESPWGVPNYKTYEILADESEYLGWLYAHGICVNHFTVDTNKLKSFDSFDAVNEFLKSKGHRLNNSGGEVKGSKEQLLEQSSTLSEVLPHKFQEGEFKIPTCFYEFSRRYVDPKSNKLFQGFIAESANKIFESTDRYPKAG